MYEQLLSWMCTQENLVDEAETIIRKEMPVRLPPSTVGHAPYLRQSGVSLSHRSDHGRLDHGRLEHAVCTPSVPD